MFLTGVQKGTGPTTSLHKKQREKKPKCAWRSAVLQLQERKIKKLRNLIKFLQFPDYQRENLLIIRRVLLLFFEQLRVLDEVSEK